MSDDGESQLPDPESLGKLLELNKDALSAEWVRQALIRSQVTQISLPKRVRRRTVISLLNRRTVEFVIEPLFEQTDQVSCPHSAVLDALLRPELAQDIQSNLEEAFQLWVARHGSEKARRIYVTQVAITIVGYWLNCGLSWIERAAKVAKGFYSG